MNKKSPSFLKPGFSLHIEEPTDENIDKKLEEMSAAFRAQLRNIMKENDIPSDFYDLLSDASHMFFTEFMSDLAKKEAVRRRENDFKKKSSQK